MNKNNTLSTYMHDSHVQFSRSYVYGSLFAVYSNMFILPCVYDRCDVFNSHFLEIFMCATVKVKTMFLDFSLSADKQQCLK